MKTGVTDANVRTRQSPTSTGCRVQNASTRVGSASSPSNESRLRPDRVEQDSHSRGAEPSLSGEGVWITAIT